MQDITIEITQRDGVVAVKGIPAGVQIVIKEEGTEAIFGEGDDNLLQQKL